AKSFLMLSPLSDPPWDLWTDWSIDNLSQAVASQPGRFVAQPGLPLRAPLCPWSLLRTLAEKGSAARRVGEVRSVSELTRPPVGKQNDLAAGGHHHGDVRRVPSFTELVYAHFAWWSETQDSNGNGTAKGTARDEYHHTLSRYEATHGELVNAYWCSHVE